MRVVHVGANDVSGGAARAAYRLHSGLRSIGCDSTMFVMHKRSGESTVKAFQPPMDPPSRLRRRLRRERITRAFAHYRDTRPAGYEQFSDDRSQYGETVTAQLPDADVINLHWVAGFVDYGAFFSEVPKHTPVAWTLHDMNPFTSGCHYDHGCGRFTDQCGACPQLGSDHTGDLSRQVWERKQAAFEKVPANWLHIVTPSRWLAGEAEQSALLGRFPVTVIPNSVDTDSFSPRDQACARKVLGIPPVAKVVLFAAQSVTNRRKGFALLAQALEQLASDDVFLLSMGSGRPDLETDIPQLHLGHVNSDRLLSAVYSAADVFVIPSLQDNLPNTVLESMACGTPVVGFDVGGIPDIVQSGFTGLLAPPKDVGALRDAIAELLEDPAKRAEMSENCRRIAVEEYALEVQAHRYVELYESILADA